MVRNRRKRYTAEFKAEAVRLLQTSDRPVTEIAEHLGVTAKTLHEWVRAVRPAAPDRLTGDERQELEQLRRENARLRMERDILKKAAAFFARETHE
jgi:transposase